MIGKAKAEAGDGADTFEKDLALAAPEFGDPPTGEPGLAPSIAAESRLSLMRVKNRFKTYVLRLSYWLAHYLAAPVVYSRQPFVRYPYMFPPSELMELTRQLLSVNLSSITRPHSDATGDGTRQ